MSNIRVDARSRRVHGAAHVRSRRFEAVARARYPWLLYAIAAVLALFCAPRVDAHAVSSNYLQLDAREGAVLHGEWDLAVSDVHWAVGLDADGNGRITWQDITARRAAVTALAARNLHIERAAQACPIEIQDLALTAHTGEPHLALLFSARCAAGSGALTVGSTIFAAQDSAQKTLAQITTAAGAFTFALAADGTRWAEPAHVSWLATLRGFVGQGMVHVWTGYDHVAFLILLLLPSVLRQRGGKWSAADSIRSILRDLLTIVTAFTVAHSITLCLAATGAVHPPVRLVEASIAFSIVAAGLLNVVPRGERWRLPLAFGFGLMHGFGFANALAELGAHGRSLAPALAGFNIGVELAQLSIVLVALPLLLKLRATSFYAARLMPWASLATAATGAVWFIQRVS